MLLDSNLIIYACKEPSALLQEFVKVSQPSVSAISLVEVLGFHLLQPEEKSPLELFFATSPILAITDNVIMRAVALRQVKKMSLGDSLIAATALESSMKLATHNVKDFYWIPDLVVIDPLAGNGQA